MEAKTIELTNVGPIEHLSIPIRPEGGITVLLGRNGVGKSKGLAAIESAATGRGKIDVRDGQAKGQVSAFGVTVTFGRSTRRSGELEVQTLEGRFSIADFVEPGLKSPEAADAKRIKVLAALSATKPDPSLFWPLLGGKENFERIVGSLAIASDDIVQMAERVKRDIEVAARKEEDQTSHLEGHARASREAAAGVDVTAPCDADELQAALEVAIRNESSLKEKAAAGAAARKRHQNAKDALEDAEANYAGPSLADADVAVEEATESVSLAADAVVAAKEALRLAEEEYRLRDLKRTTAIKIRNGAEQHEKMVASWREQVAKEPPESVSPERMAWASQQVQNARDAVENGVLVRKAKQQIVEAEKSLEQAKIHRQLAGELREAAGGTDEVLTELVAKVTKKIRVHAGRLVLDTKRGETFLHELSQGELRKLGCDIGIDAVGTPGVLVLRQDMWEGMDPIARKDIAEHVRGRGVTFLAAQCSADEQITAEVFNV